MNLNFLSVKSLIKKVSFNKSTDNKKSLVDLADYSITIQSLLYKTILWIFTEYYMTITWLFYMTILLVFQCYYMTIQWLFYMIRLWIFHDYYIKSYYYLETK